MTPLELIGNDKPDETLFDIIRRELQDRLVDFPPPPEGYVYAFDYPVMVHNPEEECWDVYVDLCLQDGYGRRIRLKDWLDDDGD